MPPTLPIRRPSLEADTTPSRKSLLCVALVSFAVGVSGASRALHAGHARSASSPRSPESPERPTVVATVERIEPALEAAPVEADRDENRALEAIEPSAQLAAPVEPAPAVVAPAVVAPAVVAPAVVAPVVVPPPPSSLARVERGRIAYIRCDGVPGHADDAACPRDLEMERVVWAAIDRFAATCPTLGAARGRADLRVVFDGRRFSGIGFREVSPPALETAIRSCIERDLANVTHSLRASRLTASFRFDIR